MNRFVIIVAGGQGLRMGNDIPKQFLEIAGLPILMHTIKKFTDFDPFINIVIPMHGSHIGYWGEQCIKYRFDKKHRVVEGGETRFHSVRNGLNSINEKEGFVAIHDAVRPLVANETIQRCFEKAELKGNAIPVVEIVDTVRMLDGEQIRIVDRNLLKRVQTPQVFSLQMLKEAYLQPYHSSFTDDAAVIESMGYEVQLVDGNKENIKITEPQDLLFADFLIRQLS